MLIFQSKDGRTQTVHESETVRIQLLKQLGWRQVETPEPVAPQPEPEPTFLQEPKPKQRKR